MRPNAALMPRNSMQQGVRWILPALVLALVALLFSARPALAQSGGKNGDHSLVNSFQSIWGPVEVHLIFGDANGKQQDYNLVDAPPDVLAMLTPQLRNEAKFPLLNPKIRYFDGQWLQNRDTICKEVEADVTHALLGTTGNGEHIYDVSCRPFKYGFMTAYVVPSAASYFIQYDKASGAQVIPIGGYPTTKVKQLQIELSVPFNVVPFTQTSSCTCHSANAFCNKDPDFTMAFSVSFNVLANSTELGSWKFGPRPQMAVEYYVGKDALAMKNAKGFEKNVADLESKLEQQFASLVVSLAATGDLSIVTVIYDIFYDLVKYGVGGLLEAVCDSNLFPAVDAATSGEFNTTTIAKMANQASAGFKTLLIAVDTANNVGFTKLDIVEGGANHALQFRLTYPPPTKPKIYNATVSANKGIHLTPPSIGTGGQQLKPGVPFLVNGSNFALAYTNALSISWDGGVAKASKSNVQWGPKGGTMKDVTVTGTFNPTPIQPATAYQFRVQTCDSITCSAWSDWLETKTESAGASTVKLWLDNKTGQPIGTAALGPRGGFVIKATIPAGTAAGTHTLNAANTGNTPEASAQVTVAAAGMPGTTGAPGSGIGATSTATIAVMNTTTHTAVKPPINLMISSTIRLRGDGFAPGTAVTVHLDTPTGPQLGTATPAKNGIFLGNFTIPYFPTGGSHTLVAVQGTIQASEAVTLMSQPK